MKFLVILSVLIASACSVVIHTPAGKVRGTKLSSRKGTDFFAFMGIPYAEPPTGNLRFRPPVKKAPWEKTWEATAYGPNCAYDARDPNVTIPVDEDCLYLNVYTKKFAGPESKPVIVFIHGGWFVQGAGRNHGPAMLMDRDVVYVSINYRLGALGFLAVGTEDAIGNMGLKDQVLALKWVKENIALFGGDPNSITISGLSAGGLSVASHITSKMSKNLFNRAIVMSSAIPWQPRMPSSYSYLLPYLYAQTGCSNFECLRTVQFSKIMRSQFLAPCKYAMVWLPVVELDFGQEKFFDENPIDVLEHRGLQDVNSNIQVMIGTSTDEIINTAAFFMANDAAFVGRFYSNFSALIYDCFYPRQMPSATAAAALKFIYLPGAIDARSLDGMAQFVSDGGLNYGTMRFASILSKYANVFHYRLAYIGQASVFSPYGAPYGVTHGDDLQYMFNTWWFGPMIAVGSRDDFMVERFSRIWENFARTGNPNNPNDSYLAKMAWPVFDSTKEYYLDISTHLVTKQALFRQRLRNWDQFYQ